MSLKRLTQRFTLGLMMAAAIGTAAAEKERNVRFTATPLTRFSVPLLFNGQVVLLCLPIAHIATIDAHGDGPIRDG